jgi:acyl-CoA synthetase (AMP-forming)/AMP-acid ligase II
VTDRVEPSDLLLWLRDRLPPYSVPTVVRIVDEIPLTTTFKPHRAEVRRTLEGDHP